MKEDEMKITELKPSNSRRSFYGKGYMHEKNGLKFCVSYSTPICVVTPNRKIIRLWEGYSQTSIAHFNSFLKVCGLPYSTGYYWNEMKTGVEYTFDEFKEKFTKHSTNRLV